MNKKEVERLFKSEIDYKKLTPTDKRLAWNDFVEMLYQNGEITEKQLYNWGHPDFINKKER